MNMCLWTYSMAFVAPATSGHASVLPAGWCPWLEPVLSGSRRSRSVCQLCGGFWATFQSNQEGTQAFHKTCSFDWRSMRKASTLLLFLLFFACAYLHLINTVWRGIRCCTWPWRDVGVKILSPPRRKLERPWIAFCCPDGFTDTRVRILLPWWLIEFFSTRRVKLTPIQSVVICTSHKPLWRGNMKVGEPKIKCCVSWPACNLSSLFNDLEDNENEWSVLKQILFNWSSAPLSRWCQTHSAVFSGFCLFYGPRVVCSLRLFWFSFCGHVLIR